MSETADVSPLRQPGSLLTRHATLIKGLSLVLILVDVVLIIRALPLGPLLQALTDWVRQQGPLAPVVFGLLYVVAVVLLFPASALTLVAGAIFGLVVGLITVSLASITGAALAFLIARYLARERVARAIEKRPLFAAVDRAVSEGGWKVVALLRLSPAVPFNLQNYLYGLTGLRFWPCILTSWVAMLPGTFLYIYLGYAGGAGLEQVGGSAGRSPWQWVALGAGLLATLAVSVYVTNLARKALARHTRLPEETRAPAPLQSGGARGAVVAAVLALLSLGAVVFVYVRPGVVKRLLAPVLGPPSVTLRETYEEKPDGPTFDHSKLDALLKKYVTPGGWVDYRGLKGDAARLDAYIEELAHAPFGEMGRTPKLALLLNAYNAFTLRLILDHYPVDSIRSIAAAERWKAVRWRVGRHTWSLEQIENEQIRPKFREPRIHFALVCAAIGCPPLRGEAYRPDRLDKQLDSQARYVHAHRRWFQFDAENDTVRLTRIYLWYRGDFEQVAGSVLKFAARYAPALKEATAAGKTPKIEWLQYNWSLNSKDNAP